MNIKINGKKYKTELGEAVLDVCRRNGIRIPTLCAHGKLKKEAVCRLCLVETNLTDKLVPSCSFPVCEKLEVVTESERIKKAREINMELLWSDHAGKCKNCKKNRSCELQNLAEEYEIENFHFVPRKGEITGEEELGLLKDNRSREVVDNGNPVIARTTEFCVECRRCINICPVKSYGFNNRAGDVVVGTPYKKPLDCIFCGACVKHCPTGAITDQNDLKGIMEKLDDLNVMSIAVVDPAVMESIRHEFPAADSLEKLTSLLRLTGFERVFDLGWGMEKYTKNMSEEWERGGNLMFSGSCPSFVIYLNKYYPRLSKYLSRTPLPERLIAKEIRGEYCKREKLDPRSLCVIAISSCTAKKTVKDEETDYVITVRELGRIIREKNISAEKIEKSFLDKLSLFEDSSKAMTRSGGLAHVLKGKTERKEELSAVNKLEEIKKVLDSVEKRELTEGFFEMTVCPGGCIRGGGQAINIKE